MQIKALSNSSLQEEEKWKQTVEREEFVSLEIQQKVVALLLKCKHISLLFAPLTNNKCQLKVDNDDELASWFNHDLTNQKTQWINGC